MTIRPCLDAAVAQRQITRHQADELDVLFSRFLTQSRLVHGDAEARRVAQERLALHLEATALQRRRVALLQATSIERNWNAVSGYRNARGEVDVAAGLLELMETFGRRDTGLSTGSLGGRFKAVFAGAVAEFETSLEPFKQDIAGRRKGTATLENIARERFGQGTGDAAAAAVADVFGRVAEGLRQRYNELGGAIGRLDTWGLPQMHNGQALRNATFEVWAERISRLLNWDEMRHALTGTPILPDEHMDVLRHVYDTVTTDGRADALPSTNAGTGRGALYKQHADHRFLKFKNADAWLEYDRDFGSGGDVFAVMMGHLKIMSRDIAAMQILGPNPEATLNWMSNEVLRHGANATRGEPALVPRRREITRFEKNATDYAQKSVHRARSMWDSYNGSADVAVDTLISAIGTTTRNTITATSLGSAILSSPSDLAFGAFARAFAGGMSIPGGVAHQIGILVRGIQEWATGADGSRAQALRAGIAFDHLANTFGNRAREANAVSPPTISRFVADQVIRKQGFAAWTDTLKDGFGLWLMGEVSDEIGNPWDQMHPPVRRTLQRYGFGAAEWDLMRGAALHDLDADGGGATILRAREIARMGVADLSRLIASDREAALAARRLMQVVDQDLIRLADDVRADLANIVRSANAASMDVGQIFGMVERVMGRLPAKLRGQLGNRTFTRAAMLRMLEDLADNTFASTEIGRYRYRTTPEFQALPEWLQRAFGDPTLTAGDVRQLLDAMTRREPRDRVEGFPSIPSDRALDKITRYFRDLSERYQEMIVQETTFAVPEATLRSRSFTSEVKPGTFQGELMRSMAQFKGFGVAVAQLHVGRVMNEVASGRVGAASLPYAVGAMAALGMLGMLSLQLKQLARGEDLRDMEDWRTWSAALAQSGGAGIYGDFFMADQNRFGGSLTGTVAGPTVGRLERFARASLGNVQQGAEGKKTNAGRELVNVGQSLDPLSSLWWTKLAWDRMGYSHLRRWLDPEADRAAARQMSTKRRDQGTGYYWPLLSPLPERAPEMGQSAR